MKGFIEHILVEEASGPLYKKLDDISARLDSIRNSLLSSFIDYNAIPDDVFKSSLQKISTDSVSKYPWLAQWHGTVTERNAMVQKQLFQQTKSDLYIYTKSLDDFSWPSRNDPSNYQGFNIRILSDEEPDKRSESYNFVKEIIDNNHIFNEGTSSHLTIATDASRHVLKYSFKDKVPYHFTISDKINQLYDFKGDKSLILARFGTALDNSEDPHPIDAFKRASELGKCLIGPKPKKSFWGLFT